MSERPADEPAVPQPTGVPEPADETPEDLARGLVEDVRRLEESN